MITVLRCSAAAECRGETVVCQSAFKVGSDSISMQFDQAAGTRRALSRSTPARPYIWRLRVFSLLTYPSL